MLEGASYERRKCIRAKIKKLERLIKEEKKESNVEINVARYISYNVLFRQRLSRAESAGRPSRTNELRTHTQTEEDRGESRGRFAYTRLPATWLPFVLYLPDDLPTPPPVTDV